MKISSLSNDKRLKNVLKYESNKSEFPLQNKTLKKFEKMLRLQKILSNFIKILNQNFAHQN
jgi:hypothetical protein